MRVLSRVKKLEQQQVGSKKDILQIISDLLQGKNKSLSRLKFSSNTKNGLFTRLQ